MSRRFPAQPLDQLYIPRRAQRCADRFAADPEGFLDGTAAAAPAGNNPHAGRGGYICPMCPEVWSAEPAPCPDCGMALG